MLYLVVGLVLFLGIHSVRIYADDWRTERIARMGPGAWTGLYAVASLLGFVLVSAYMATARRARCRWTSGIRRSGRGTSPSC